MIFLARYSWILFVFENADDDPWQIKPWWTLYRASAESDSSVTRGMVCWRVLGKGVCVTALIKCRYYSAFEFIWEIVCVKLCLWVIPVSYVWLSVCSAHHTGISTRLIISSRRPTEDLQFSSRSPGKARITTNIYIFLFSLCLADVYAQNIFGFFL